MNIETANRLLQYRKENNLSQEELAEKIGVSRQAVSKWELDETLPDTDNLIKIADLFFVSVEYLVNADVYRVESSSKIKLQDIDKYDVVNFLAAFSSALVSTIALIYYATIGCIQFEVYKDGRRFISIYWETRYYEVINEIVIVFFLIIVITVSLLIAKRIYKNSK